MNTHLNRAYNYGAQQAYNDFQKHAMGMDELIGLAQDYPEVAGALGLGAGGAALGAGIGAATAQEGQRGRGAARGAGIGGAAGAGLGALAGTQYEAPGLIDKARGAVEDLNLGQGANQAWKNRTREALPEQVAPSGTGSHPMNPASYNPMNKLRDLLNLDQAANQQWKG